MEYEGLGPIDREDADKVLNSGSPEQISRVLLRLALHDPDWRFVQERCLRFAEHPDIWVRRNSATSLGHIARLHRKLDTTRAVAVLEKMKADPDVASWAESALDDLTVFLAPVK